MSQPITHLFTDVGGVLATNGWDRPLRRKTAAHFGVDADDLDERHHYTYDTYESGKISLEVYLNRIIFHEPRPFTHADVVRYILEEARPYQEMIDLIRAVREKHAIKIAVVSNEGREIAEDRIRRFRLDGFVDFFVVSAFVHFRKPDTDIFRLALDIAQADPARTVYIEDQLMFAQVARSVGLRAIHHVNVAKTREELASYGLAV